MICIQEPFSPEVFYEEICPTDSNLLFFDIETTGFSREFHQIYLIGAASRKGNQWELMQWFAESPSEEGAVIEAFLDYANGYDTLIHFNGQRFDLPFTQARAEYWNIPWEMNPANSIDLMNLIKPYKDLCGLKNCRQKSIEELLGIQTREDEMNGGELIPVYYNYVKKRDKKSLHLLLLHNADDVRGMTDLTRIGLWPDFFHSDFRFSHLDTYAEGIRIHYLSDRRMPVLLSAQYEQCAISAGGNELTIALPYFRGELNHYFKNYKDYYYLPAEDMIVHKSVAIYVDKSARQKATKQNCFVKKDGLFLPQPAELVAPAFAKDCKCKKLWFEVCEGLEDAEFWTEYLQALLPTIIKGY